VTNRPQSS